MRIVCGAAIAVAALFGGFGGGRASASPEEGPTLTTSPQPAQGTVGVTELKDKASISQDELFILVFLGGHLDVTFSLWAPGTCGNEGATPVFTETDGVNGPGDVTTWDSYVPLSVGTYDWTAVLQWHGSFGGPIGDGPPFIPNTFTVAASGCQAEPVAITKAETETTTTPSDGGPIGTAISDSASVKNGYKPSGTVTFSLFSPNDSECEEPVHQWEVSLHDGSASTTDAENGSFTANQVGTWRWTASYSGDDNNAAAFSGCGSENVVITKATPKLSTTPSGSGPIGTGIGDSATVSGGHNPTGSVAFKLFGPDDPACDGKPLHTETGPLSNGTASTHSAYLTTTAGTYHWVASYSGDSKNNSVTAPCTDESQTIGKATPTITSTPSAGGNAGTAISDNAVVGGGDNPTGTVTFSLYGAGDTSCSNAPVYTNTVSLSNGSAQSGSFSSTGAAGTYSWIATYNGDANNGSISGKCGDETAVITKPASSVQAATSGPSTPSTGVLDRVPFALGFILVGVGFVTALLAMPAVIGTRRRRL